MEYLTTKQINNQIDKLRKERELYRLTKIVEYFNQKIKRLRTLRKEILKNKKNT